MAKNSFFKNLSYSVLANGTNALVALILALFVPKILGADEYSYWQLYLFYASYVGFFHFGWADGIYLRFGGEKYSDLDKNYFNTQFWMLTFLEIILAVGIAAVTILFVDDANKSAVFIAVGACCLLQIPRTFLQYVLQATDKVANYAKNFLLEKIIYAGLVIVLLAAGRRDFQSLVGADLISRGITLVLLVYQCRDIVFRKLTKLSSGLYEAWINLSIGIKLMVANIAGNLLLGVVRWAIQNHWSVETFGRVTLSITASNLLMTLISAVSIVIYPMLKNISVDKYPGVYEKMRNMLMIPVLGMLIIYYPAKELLSWWLPQYADSLRYMALLFPMCVFESKMTMLVSTYLKAMRKERAIMLINWGAVGITVITTGILVYGMDNLILAIASLSLLIGIRCTIGEGVIVKHIKVSIWRDAIAEWILVIIFVYSGWVINSVWTTIIYLAAYVCYLIWKREALRQLIAQCRTVWGKKRNVEGSSKD